MRESRSTPAVPAAETAAASAGVSAWFTSCLPAGAARPLFLDAHFVADAGHAFDLAGEGDRVVDLGLAVDVAAELDFALAGHDGDIEALHARIREQRGLHPGGEYAV